jgi:hypothetical protein
MVGPWEIRFPPPLAPARPGDSIHERKQLSKRQRRKHDTEYDAEHDQQPDDDPAHIDDYA